MTFSDWLLSFVGQREEKASIALGSPQRSEKLSNGKTIKVFSKTWRNSHYSYEDHLDWVEGEGSVVGGVTYTNESCSYSLVFNEGMVVGYDGGDCRNYPYSGGELPFRTPAAPWSGL